MLEIKVLGATTIRDYLLLFVVFFRMIYKEKTKQNKIRERYFVCMFRFKHSFLLSPFPKRRRLFWLFFCRYDYLKITNEHNQTVGKYCGVKTGRNVYVTGRFAVISFHSDGSRSCSGYLLNFSYISGYIFLTFTYF